MEQYFKMNKLKKILFTLTIVSIFAGCKKAPTACFTTDKTTAAINTPIKCDASCSKNAKLYVWLGHGTKVGITGNSSIVTYSYNLAGTYIIRLEVTNGGKESVMSRYVNIY